MALDRERPHRLVDDPGHVVPQLALKLPRLARRQQQAVARPFRQCGGDDLQVGADDSGQVFERSGSCKDRNESFRVLADIGKPSLAKGQTGRTDPILVPLQKLTGIQTLSQVTDQNFWCLLISIRKQSTHRWKKILIRRHEYL